MEITYHFENIEISSSVTKILIGSYSTFSPFLKLELVIFGHLIDRAFPIHEIIS